MDYNRKQKKKAFVCNGERESEGAKKKQAYSSALKVLSLICLYLGREWREGQKNV